MSDVTIRPAVAADQAAWLPLWKAYQVFYQVEIPDAVTEATWARIVDPDQPINAFIAQNQAGEAVGMTTYIEHLSTWFATPVGYLQDLYVNPDLRGGGVGRALINAVIGVGRSKGWGRVYWTTKEDNATARILYDKVAKFNGFIRYDINL